MPLIDRLQMQLCCLTYAPRCRSFEGIASYGYCAAKDEHFYGFRGHLNISLNGVITGFTVPNCYSSITIFSTLILTDHLYSRDDRFFVEFTNHSVNSSNLVLG